MFFYPSSIKRDHLKRYPEKPKVNDVQCFGEHVSDFTSTGKESRVLQPCGRQNCHLSLTAMHIHKAIHVTLQA